MAFPCRLGQRSRRFVWVPFPSLSAPVKGVVYGTGAAAEAAMISSVLWSQRWPAVPERGPGWLGEDPRACV